MIVGAGAFSLVFAELRLRRGFGTTASALSGAGISLLYVGLVAGHTLYRLIPTTPAFALMGLVTVVACLLSIRYNALFTALLGLVGGFATPVLLSTGQDRPIGFFSYLFLLNAGLLAVARRQNWRILVNLSIAATFFMQIGWFLKYMAPGRASLALAIFMAFSILFLGFGRPRARAPVGGAPDGATPAIGIAPLVASLSPYVFALFMAGDARYAPEWPVIAAFVFVLSAGLQWVSLRLGSFELAAGASALAALAQLTWFARFQTPANFALGASIFASFGALHLLAAAVRANAGQSSKPAEALVLGPPLFALFLTLDSDYAGYWPTAALGILGYAAIGLAVARWRSLLLAFAGLPIVIFLAETGWQAQASRLGSMPSALATFLGFASVGAFLMGPAKSPLPGWLGTWWAAVSFAFATLAALIPGFGVPFEILFAFCAALSIVVLVGSERAGTPSALSAGAVGCATTLACWPLGEPAFFPIVSAAGLALLWNLVPNARREAAGVIAASGLALLGLRFALRPADELTAEIFVVLGALLACAALRTGFARLSGVATLLAAYAAMLGVAFAAARPPFSDRLIVPLLAATAFSMLGVVRAASRARGPAAADEDEHAVLIALAGALLSVWILKPANDALFAGLAIILALLIFSVLRTDWTRLLPVGAALGGLTAWALSKEPHAASDLAWLFAWAVAFTALPFVVPRSTREEWREHHAPFVASALAGAAFFPAAHRTWTSAWGDDAIGLLAVLFAALAVAAFPAALRALGEASGERLGTRALYALSSLGFVALAIPLQLDRQWITVSWAIQGAATLWLFTRLPHPGVKWFGASLLAVAGVRLLLNPAVLEYEERAAPVFNWLLYTYGVPAVASLWGAHVLRRRQNATGDTDLGGRAFISKIASVQGLLLLFWLVNLEILDAFSPGRFITYEPQRVFARDLAISIGWLGYSMAMLFVGTWKKIRALRLFALGFFVLSILHVVIVHLFGRGGIYRVLSFLALGAGLIFVSFFYQRFVLRDRDAEN